MAVLIASDLAKDMAGEPLLRGVSFKLGRRERLSLSGRNGAGKTTLLRMLAGQASIDGGELHLAKGVRLALHDQRPPRARERTLRDYVLSGCSSQLELERELARLEEAMAAGDHGEATLNRYAEAQGRFEHVGGYRWRDRATATLRGLGFDEDALERSLSSFSGGELTRASLARALAAEPDLLLLDEPTNHLDIAALEWLEQTLVGLDAAVVLVAHDRWFLEAVGTAVLELEGGRSRFFPGTWHAWRAEKAAQDLALGRAVERQRAEQARLERFVARFRDGTRARQAQARQRQLERMRPIEGRPREAQVLAFTFKPPARSGRVIFELERGRLEAGGRVLLDDAELWLERGEHVSLVGANGTGKTTLLEVLAGRRPLDGGALRRGHNVQLGYLSQHAEELDAAVAGGTGTALEAAQRATGLTPNRARALLGRFLFSGESADKPLAGLSGGERRRLSLAVLVASGANVLVLDEPTNHLDLDSREALEDALRDFPGSVLLVSHDRALLDAVGSRTVVIEDGTLRSYAGGWPEYVRAREQRRAAQGAGAEPPPEGKGPTAGRARGGRAAGRPSASRGAGDAARARPRTSPKERRAQAAAERRTQSAGQRAQRELERRVERAEAALRALEAELADPAAWSDPERAAQAAERHARARRELDELYARWEAVAS